MYSLIKMKGDLGCLFSKTDIITCIMAPDYKTLFSTEVLIFFLLPNKTILLRSASLTLVLLNRIYMYPAFANSVDPDQLASEEAN